MPGLLKNSLIASGLLVFGLVANAQIYRGDDRYWNNNRHDYRYDDRRFERSVVEQVSADLDRAASNAYSGGAQRRLANARKDLWDFQSRLAQGRFDRHELDEVIGNMQRAVNDRGLDYRDRALLQSDLNRLREFRAYGGGYNGYRGDPYGYRSDPYGYHR